MICHLKQQKKAKCVDSYLDFLSAYELKATVEQWPYNLLLQQNHQEVCEKPECWAPNTRVSDLVYWGQSLKLGIFHKLPVMLMPLVQDHTLKSTDIEERDLASRS